MLIQKMPSFMSQEFLVVTVLFLKIIKLLAKSPRKNCTRLLQLLYGTFGTLFSKKKIASRAREAYKGAPT